MPRPPLVACVLLLVAFASLRAQQREVVIYVSHDQEHSQAILEDFERESGITVRAQYDTEDTKTVGLVNRIIAEGRPARADVFWNNECGQTLRLQDLGLLQPYVSPQAATIPPGMKDTEGHWTGFGARARVLIYNRQKISEDALPRTMEQLADPKFRGMLAMARPKTGTTLTHAGALYAAWGPEKADAWFDRLMANDVRWESGNGPVARSVAEGIRPFGLTDTDDANGMRLDGAPVSTIFLDQDAEGLGTLVIPNTVMILAGAPHPVEARALVDYLLSPAVEASLAAGRAAQMPLQPGVDIPDNVTPVEAIESMDVDYAAVGRMIGEHGPSLAERFERGVDTGGSSNTLWIALGVLVVILVVIALAAGGRRRAASA